MKIAALAAALVAFAVVTMRGEAAVATGMVRIPAGAFRPLYGATVSRRIAAFDMDAAAVSNGDYLDFVRAHPEWRRSRAKRLFVDEAYLREWTGDLEPGVHAPLDAPVVSVSWFAARAYLKANARQLPTVDQWEYAAGLRNLHSVIGLRGPLSEWTLDFNSGLVNGESRGDGSLDRTLYCGAGATAAADTRDYAAFLRFAFRNSLDPRYSVSTLGFRGVRAVAEARR